MKIDRIIYPTIFLIVLIYTVLYNFLLFHFIVEFTSITIAISVFIIFWNRRKTIENSFFLIVGISHLFVSFIDVIHTLAYKGMDIFTGYDADLPTQLWIIARYMQAISFFAALIISRRKSSINANKVMVLYILLTTILLLALFQWDLIPSCFNESSGLTPFKVVSEYVISAINLISLIYVFRKKRSVLEKKVYQSIIIYLIASIASEMFFTLYADVYGITNILGHIFKVVAFFAIYIGIIETSLNQPMNLLYKELKDREQKLTKALEDVKNLQELLPICSKCKKIKDDEGYWHQLEAYLTKHNDILFTHGLCEDCAAEFYREFEDFKKSDEFEKHEKIA